GLERMLELQVQCGDELLTPAASPADSAAAVAFHTAASTAGTPARAAAHGAPLDSSISSALPFTPHDPRLSPASSAGARGAEPYRGHIQELRDGVGERFTLRLRDGRMFRASLGASHRCGVVRACMASLACSLSAALLNALRSDLLRL